MGLDKHTASKISAPVNPALIKQNRYDKFGDGDYISTETVTRLLNEIFGYVWDWSIIDFKHIKNDNEEYVICHGQLNVPGVGVRDGIGQVKAQGGNKDNSTMYSAASSFAFKSAAKRFGIAPNIFDKEGWQAGVGVFDPSFTPAPKEQESIANPEPENRMPIQESAPPQADLDMSSSEMVGHNPVPDKPEPQSQKQVPESAKEKGAELRDAYGISNQQQFVAFAAIWNPQITDFSQITEEVIHSLHEYVENNPEEFEDFVASDY